MEDKNIVELRKYGLDTYYNENLDLVKIPQEAFEDAKDSVLKFLVSGRVFGGRKSGYADMSDVYAHALYYANGMYCITLVEK